jgi:glycine cleavage system protein P-like pyridoxal-binding family
MKCEHGVHLDDKFYGDHHARLMKEQVHWNAKTPINLMIFSVFCSECYNLKNAMRHGQRAMLREVSPHLSESELTEYMEALEQLEHAKELEVRALSKIMRLNDLKRKEVRRELDQQAVHNSNTRSELKALKDEVKALKAKLYPETAHSNK